MRKSIISKTTVLVLTALMTMFISGCTEKTTDKTMETPIENVSENATNDASETETEEKENVKMLNIGINEFAENPSLDDCIRGFIDGLKEEGFEDGKNIKIDRQNAMADGTNASQISSSFVSRNYDLICGVATPSAQSAFNATQGTNIPVIFSAVSDPVGAQIVNSLENPEGNATGTSDSLPIEAQLKMIRAFLPDSKTIGILYTTSEANSTSQIAEYERLAPTYGFTIVKKGINISSDIPLATDAILDKVDCITNLTDNTVVSSLAVIIDKTNAKKIPVFGSEQDQLELGCLASEGLNYYELGIQTGKIAAKVLNGADPATTPVELIQDASPFVNTNASEFLNISIPEEYKNATIINTKSN